VQADGVLATIGRLLLKQQTVCLGTHEYHERRELSALEFHGSATVREVRIPRHVKVFAFVAIDHVLHTFSTMKHPL
jgi:hypothetical protein